MRTVLVNVAILVIEKGVSIALVFFAEAIIARNMSASDYGRWVYALNIVLLLGTLAVTVGAEVLVPILVRAKLSRWRVLANAFYIRLIGGLLAYGLLLIYAQLYVTDKVVSEVLMLAGLTIVMNESAAVIVAHYQSLVKIKYIAVVRLLGLVVRLAAVYLWYLTAAPAGLASWGRVAESIFVALAFLLLWRFAASKNFRLKFESKLAVGLAKRGLAFMPAIVLMYIFQRMDRIFAEKFNSFDYVGQYGVAMQIIEQLNVLAMLGIQSIAPAYIFKQRGTGGLNRALVITFGVALVMAVICFFAAWMAPMFINILYGDRYGGAIEILRPMLVIPVAYAVDWVLTNILIAKGAHAWVVVKWIISLGFALTASYVYYVLLNGRSTNLITIFNYAALVPLSVGLFFLHRIREDA